MSEKSDGAGNCHIIKMLTYLEKCQQIYKMCYLLKKCNIIAKIFYCFLIENDIVSDIKDGPC